MGTITINMKYATLALIATASATAWTIEKAHASSCAAPTAEEKAKAKAYHAKMAKATAAEKTQEAKDETKMKTLYAGAVTTAKTALTKCFTDKHTTAAD